MEITKGIIEHFRVASITVCASNERRNETEFEFLLVHNELDHKVRGFVTLTSSDRLIARSSAMNGASMSAPAREKARKLMRAICKCIIREHE